MKDYSSLGRKQRKALYNLPWHQRRKKMGVHLETKLMEKYHVRSVPVRKGDTVKVLRGDADMVGMEAKVAVINIPSMKIVVEGITLPKADGKQKQRWIDPSNVIITKLDLSDPKRRKRIEMRGKLAEGTLKKEAEAEVASVKDGKEEKKKEPVGRKESEPEKIENDKEAVEKKAVKEVDDDIGKEFVKNEITEDEQAEDEDDEEKDVNEDEEESDKK